MCFAFPYEELYPDSNRTKIGAKGKNKIDKAAICARLECGTSSGESLLCRRFISSGYRCFNILGLLVSPVVLSLFFPKININSTLCWIGLK